jgi:HAD superfamily hydrolase (TIGR01509 family)
VAPDHAGDLTAVLFDMDGTLTDSEKLWTIALERVADGLGGTMSVLAREAMVGQDIHHSVGLLIEDLGVVADVDETVQLLVATTGEIFADGLPWQPGAERLLVEVRAAGIRTALVTATHRELVETALNTLGRDRFDVLVCGDDDVAPKPSPEPYLRALDLLGVEVSAAVAIEDSPNGSRAAAAAGLPVLVVPSEVPVPRAPGLVFAESLEDIGVADLREIRRGSPAG